MKQPDEDKISYMQKIHVKVQQGNSTNLAGNMEYTSRIWNEEIC